jgi:cellulose synthase/poly-beta-1,6-N-acetylglucosamine synthase-like glycosyltransferase
MLLVEITAALILAPRKVALYARANNRRPLAVLIPAHNEGMGIFSTIANVRAQLVAGDRLVVVADNCTDDTAHAAASAGAEVLERYEPTKVGKGYALDFGIRHLSLDPPEIVVVIDADCKVAEHTIARLATACAASRRPVQALDLMTAPPDSPINYQVAEFAWRMKNWIRPLGLDALNLPCQLMGTGMAFPWSAICFANLASASVVEDMKLGLELAEAGFPPLFCPSARVTSEFPLTLKGAKSQRHRWEHGHIRMILTTAPRLLWRAVIGANRPLLALTLDLAIPPLSLLISLLMGTLLIAALAMLSGASSAPFSMTAITFAMLIVAIVVAWAKFGRDILPIGSLFSVVSYMLAKFPIYFRALSLSVTSQWTRTDRKKSQ